MGNDALNDWANEAAQNQYSMNFYSMYIYIYIYYKIIIHVVWIQGYTIFSESFCNTKGRIMNNSHDNWGYTL